MFLHFKLHRKQISRAIVIVCKELQWLGPHAKDKNNQQKNSNRQYLTSALVWYWGNWDLRELGKRPEIHEFYFSVSQSEDPQ